MILRKAVHSVFAQLSDSINQLSQEEYVMPCKNLFGNSIGQHVRHIIELFQCLDEGYQEGIINYENRKRDLKIETDKQFSTYLLRNIYEGLQKDDKSLILLSTYDELTKDPVRISTNYYREIAYNLEHTIHHMALIRIGISEVSTIAVPKEFGVAGSTIKYRRSCAQ
ncbi:MAG: hypothetical protein C5B52_14195 [Bacteroidetes bacterium]|nr:MAG: hypothetical protein C5B52_14195 [Bacteroidota bacterium]